MQRADKARSAFSSGDPEKSRFVHDTNPIVREAAFADMQLAPESHLT
jgi:hypothetical protein